MGVLITPHTAREYARRSALVRAARRQARKFQRNASMPAYRQQARASEVNGEDYPAKRRVRVRAPLTRIDRMAMRESDPHRLARLTSAQMRLWVGSLALFVSECLVLFMHRDSSRVSP